MPSSTPAGTIKRMRPIRTGRASPGGAAVMAPAGISAGSGYDLPVPAIDPVGHLLDDLEPVRHDDAVEVRHPLQRRRHQLGLGVHWTGRDLVAEPGLRPGRYYEIDEF